MGKYYTVDVDDVLEINYSGAVDTVEVRTSGLYKLEVYGAQGQGTSGGKGGHAAGFVHLNRGEILYVCVGGSGVNGGFNGGGLGTKSHHGGGCTHISKIYGELCNTDYYDQVTADRLLIVAGGGGAMTAYAGGTGGGTNGGAANSSGSGTRGMGGTQTEGGAGYGDTGAGTFGQGGSNTTYVSGSGVGGGGGGLFGGGAGSNQRGGGGGSGYTDGVPLIMTVDSVVYPVNENGKRSGDGIAYITLYDEDNNYIYTTESVIEKPTLYLLDKSFKAVSPVDDYISMIWTERFDSAGDFELYFDARSSTAKKMELGDYIQYDRSDRLMIIESKQYKEAADDEDRCIIKGRSLESLLDRRVVWKQTNVKTDVQAGIKKLLDANLINPTDTKRKIPNVIFTTKKDSTLKKLTLDAQYHGDSLYDIVVDICQSKHIGFKLIKDPNNKMRFRLYLGVDRSTGQNKAPAIIFSPKFDNLQEITYTEDMEKYTNVLLVLGEGNGSNKKSYAAGNGEGIERRESTYNFNISSTTTEEGTMSAADYNKKMKSKGKKVLEKRKDILTFDASLTAGSIYVSGRDYNVGDAVQFEDSYGHSMKTRITEITYSYDENGYSSYPTFEKYKEATNEDDE